MKIDLQTNLLITLAEECGEITQRVSKILRFGLHETREGANKDNCELLLDEINDFIAIVGMLETEKILPPVFDALKVYNKKEKVERWMNRSRSQKCLQ